MINLILLTLCAKTASAVPAAADKIWIFYAESQVFRALIIELDESMNIVVIERLKCHLVHFYSSLIQLNW